MQTLREQQRYLSKLIQGAQLQPEDNQILEQPPLSVQERLNIYQQAYKQRIEESLAEDFPTLCSLLNSDSEGSFSKLVDEYLKTYPSSYWTLAQVGENLSEFLRQSSWQEKYPFLADLAQLEWFKILSHLALEAKSFDFSLVAQIPEEQQDKIILQLNQSVFFLQTQWALHLEPIFPQNTFYLIYKKQGEVKHSVLSQEHGILLKKIQQGCPLGQLTCEHLEQEQLSACFALFVSENILSHFTIEGEIF